MALPKFIGLKSIYNNKCLHFVKEDVEVHGFLKFYVENIVSPYTKFEVQKAKTGDGLVSIKCCYNNKYFVRWSPNHWWIVAGADKPDEDKSNWSCTLFEPIFADDKTIRFRHVQLNHYACLWRLGSKNVYDSCLFTGSESVDKDRCDFLTMTDWDSMCILPRHMVFKGNYGYLSLRQIHENLYLQFGVTVIDSTSSYEVFTVADGSIHIKSNDNNKFWRRTIINDFIWADSNDTTSVDLDTLFWTVRTDDNRYTLKCIGNNNLYCKRFTIADTTSCLSANSDFISQMARLEVEELVTSRNIYNVNYHVKDARIYNQTIGLLMAGGTVVNRTQEPKTFNLKLAYIQSKSSAWNANVSPMSGVKPDIKASVPVMNADGKVEIPAESIGVFEWGKKESSSDIVEIIYKVTVAPLTLVKVTMRAIKGSFDIPFSYDQSDTLSNGNSVTLTMDDGVYTGISSYNFTYEIEEEKLAVAI